MSNIYIIADHERIKWFIASDKQGEVMGYAGLEIENCAIQHVYCGPCYVFPAYRGKGLQLELLHARTAWAQQKGFSCLTTCVDCDNIYSRANVEAFGFVETHRSSCGKEIFYKKEIK